MSSKSELRAAREDVAAYHQAQLTGLVARVSEVIDRFGAGELDAFEVDQVLVQYSRAAKELWKFCNLGSSKSRRAHPRGATDRLVGAGAPRRR